MRSRRCAASAASRSCSRRSARGDALGNLALRALGGLQVTLGGGTLTAQLAQLAAALRDGTLGLGQGLRLAPVRAARALDLGLQFTDARLGLLQFGLTFLDRG